MGLTPTIFPPAQTPEALDQHIAQLQEEIRRLAAERLVTLRRLRGKRTEIRTDAMGTSRVVAR